MITEARTGQYDPRALRSEPKATLADSIPPLRGALSSGHRAWLAGVVVLTAALCLSGCLSPRYQRASKKTPPPVMLNAKFPSAPLQGNLETLIMPDGPGSWKKKAYWDEYVVTLRNSSDQPLQITAAELVDFTGDPKQPGEDPWKLERESKSLAKRYQDAGMTVVRVAGPRVLVTAAEPTVAGATLGTAGAATAATATAVALPVYGATILGINVHNRKSITAEFNRRRLTLPLILPPGETKTGSLFFPMVPNPQKLIVHWSSESRGGDSGDSGHSGGHDLALPLEFLQGLHVKGAPETNATKRK